MATVLNAMTVDLEDWAQAVLDPRLPVSERVVKNVERVLEFLGGHGVKATFFALGRVCEAWPGLLPMIRGAGHEIASHGYGHDLVYNLTARQFAEDLHKSREIIETQIGERPRGYRAPAFSITARSLWARGILAEAGFEYSSSVFPIRKRRYGIADAPRCPHRWPDCELVEFPMTTLWLGGRAWPACGGGYTRLLPAAIMAHAIRKMNAAGQPAVIYMHPYELAAGEVSEFMHRGTHVSLIRRFTQELWRSRVRRRLSRLFGEFQFGTMSAALTECGLLRTPVLSTIAHPPLEGWGTQPVARDGAEQEHQDANFLTQSAT